MYTESKSLTEIAIHCTYSEFENIYRGLFLVLNIEKDPDKQKEIRKQITAIESIHPKIEF